MKEVVAIFPTNNWAGYWFRDVSIFLKAKQPDQWKSNLRLRELESRDLRIRFCGPNTLNNGRLCVEFDETHTDALHIYSAIIDTVNSQEGAKQKFAALAEGIKKASASSSDT